MTSHRRVKDIAYDEHDLYSDDDDDDMYDGAGEEYTAEEKQNFATLTPVVRAHLEEAGLQASDRQIEDALWHYYWDVNKSVDYLTAQQQPSKRKSAQAQESQKQTGSKSKFDQALEKSNNQIKGECSKPTWSQHAFPIVQPPPQRTSTSSFLRQVGLSIVNQD